MNGKVNFVSTVRGDDGGSGGPGARGRGWTEDAQTSTSRGTAHAGDASIKV